MNASSLDFGMMLGPATMMTMCTVLPVPECEIQFKLNLFYREITVEFLLDIRDERIGRGTSKVPNSKKDQRQDRFRFQIPFSQLDTIHRVDNDEDNVVVLLISLETPPKFFKKLDPAQTHEDDARHWSDKDSWYRQTDVVYTQGSLKKSALTLKKTRPIIDLGESNLRLIVSKKVTNCSRSLDHLSFGI